MRTTLVRFLDLGARAADDPDLRIRKRATVGTIVATIFAALWYLVLGLIADRAGIWTFAVLQIGIQLSLLVYLQRTGRLTPVVVVVLAAGLGITASGVVAFGGLLQSNGNLVLAVLVPMGAVLLLGRRAGLPAYLAFAALVVGAAITNAMLRTLLPIPPAMGAALYAMNLLVAGGIALALVTFIDGERLRAKAQSETLLLNVLPRAIVARLQGGERVIADHCPEVTVLFSDVVDFTPFSERVPPERLVQVLNDLFTGFDELAERYRLEKIKTIGDAYMVVAGVPEARSDHVQVMLEMAISMHALAAARPAVDGRRLQLRTGIATGPVVAGVIGRRKFSYDLWGDTVNTASRMESSGVPGCIQVTRETWGPVRDRYPWQVRQDVDVKGKGQMTTYLLDPSSVSPTVG
ncbi:MAG TPA: adenylate/guanylate cyclase domain-containing protein [Candidatus Limnocylindria bacterium]|nr:adenylate/guanylate cyclase domain-containing protein [Candidatus Limnocylindria bacterium]